MRHSRSFGWARSAGPPAPLRQRAGDKSRLVVAPLPDPPPMKWNRREKGLCVPAQMAVHEMRQRLGNAGPAAIFELQHDTTRAIAIGDGGAGTVIFRRMGAAGAAFGIGGSGGRPERMQQGSPRKCRSCPQLRQDRTSVVEGKGGEVRV